MVVSTILPPERLTSRWSPTLCLRICAAFYCFDEARPITELPGNGCPSSLTCPLAQPNMSVKCLIPHL